MERTRSELVQGRSKISKLARNWRKVARKSVNSLEIDAKSLVKGRISLENPEKYIYRSLKNF